MIRKCLLLSIALGLSGFALIQLGSSAQLATKAWLSQYLIEQAWSRTLSGEERVRPWPWADTWPVAELNVPSMGLKQVVLSGDNGTALAFGPGMSEYVDAGLDLGFTIMSGHRDTHFRFLEDISLEDEFIVTGADGLSRRYQVLETRVVDEQWSFPDVADGIDSLMILATCYPFDEMTAGADKRLLVFAVPVGELA